MVAAAIRAVNKSSGSFGTLYNSLTGKFSQEPKGQLIATAISLGIGLGAGLIAGILVYNVNKQLLRLAIREHILFCDLELFFILYFYIILWEQIIPLYPNPTGPSFAKTTEVRSIRTSSAYLLKNMYF